jgi:hypothetical protein
MATLSKKKQAAQQLQQLAVDRQVLTIMHELLRQHLEATGKFTAEERTIWERDVMCPEMLKYGITVTPAIRVPVPEKPLVHGPGPLRLVETPPVKIISDRHAPTGPTVEPTMVNPASYLES